MPPRRRPGSPKDEGKVGVMITRDEHSASPGEGFDLHQVALSNANLIAYAMGKFGIDAAAPNAKEQLHRALTKLKLSGRKTEAGRAEVQLHRTDIGAEARHATVTYTKRVPRRGRKPDGLKLTIEMAAAGLTSADEAPIAAKKLAVYRGQRAGLEGLTQKIRRHRRGKPGGRKSR